VARSARRRLLALALLVSTSALGAEVNGYVESRTQYTRARVDGVLSTESLPELQQLLEFNVQVRQEYRPGGLVSADLSLFLQAAGHYRTLDAQQQEVGVAPSQSAAAQPIASINELYLHHELRSWLNVLVGKKRFVWGSGLAYNPTDLLNPPKDPTDPTYQRAGAWMARVEAPFERYTFTLLASPAVVEQQSGLPRSVLAYPSWDKQDKKLHYLLVARAYALVLDADVNLMLLHSNLYSDSFEHKTRLGVSFSRYFFTNYELHVESLLGTGSSRVYGSSECLKDRVAAVACFTSGEPLFSRKLLDEKKLRPRVLVGTRYAFSDESELSAEYLYQADGLKQNELQDYVNGLSLLRLAEQLGLDTSSVNLGGGQAGLPQKFSFEPVARHYAFLSFQKPKIHDDFTFSAVLVANLQDFSGLVAPSLAWSTTEWLTLTLSAFVPFAGPSSRAVTVPESTTRVSEFSLLPLKYRGLFQARVFY
jgi:hypothetical protein